MRTKRHLALGRCGRAIAITCVVAALGAGFASPSARGQSDADALAPWQGPGSNWSEPYADRRVAHSRGHMVEGAIEDAPIQGDGGQCAECGSGPACSNGACDFSNPWLCGLDAVFNGDRLWFRGEYLIWWGKSANLPPLASTSPTNTSYSQAGVLTSGGTNSLFGGAIDPGGQSGVRLSLGYWLSPCHDLGIEATYFALGNKSAGFDATSEGTPILAQPFYNAQTFAEDALVLAYPDIQTGSIAVRDSNELNSFELLLRRTLVQQCDRQLDLVFGYRYAKFNEDLSIESSTTYISTVGRIPVGTVVRATDLFSGHNEFNGAEIGLSAKTACCRLSLEMLGKLAIGSMQSRVGVSGSSSVAEPNQTPLSYTTGLLSQRTNMPGSEETSFAVIPELGLTLGYDITCRLKATAGYTVMYWSKVARPGDQIDRELNPSQFQGGTLAGMPSPQPAFVTDDYWVQGLNVGLDYRF